MRRGDLQHGHVQVGIGVGHPPGTDPGPQHTPGAEWLGAVAVVGGEQLARSGTAEAMRGRDDQVVSGAVDDAGTAAVRLGVAGAEQRPDLRLEADCVRSRGGRASGSGVSGCGTGGRGGRGGRGRNRARTRPRGRRRALRGGRRPRFRGARGRAEQQGHQRDRDGRARPRHRTTSSGQVTGTALWSARGPAGQGRTTILPICSAFSIARSPSTASLEVEHAVDARPKTGVDQQPQQVGQLGLRAHGRADHGQLEEEQPVEVGRRCCPRGGPGDDDPPARAQGLHRVRPGGRAHGLDHGVDPFRQSGTRTRTPGRHRVRRPRRAWPRCGSWPTPAGRRPAPARSPPWPRHRRRPGRARSDRAAGRTGRTASGTRSTTRWAGRRPPRS